MMRRVLDRISPIRSENVVQCDIPALHSPEPLMDSVSHHPCTISPRTYRELFFVSFSLVVASFPLATLISIHVQPDADSTGEE
jgi:hypothetical protein